MSNREHKSEFILVVDDDWMNREVIEAHLLGAGYQVSVVHSGEQALDLAQRHPPDLVLLDVRMQGMNGFDTCQKLKAAEKTHSVPVMMVTALEGDEERIKAINAGADDLIAKPFTSLTLLTRVRNLLRLKHLSDELHQRDQALREVLGRYVDAETASRILADLHKPEL